MQTLTNAPGATAVTVTTHDVKRSVASARKSHATSKEAAAEAAAQAYMVWRNTLAPGADPLLTEAMKQWVAERNEEIRKENKRVSARQDLGRAERRKLQQMEIAARQGASRFTIIVKYVFDFVRSADSSTVARYAKALEWIDARFGDAVVHDTADIVSAIKSVGGFEDVIHAARGKPERLGNTDRDRIKGALNALAKKAVDDAEAKMDVAIALEAEDDVVLLLGRYGDGKLEVIADRVVQDEEISRWVAEFRDDIALHVDPRTELVAQALDIGKLVAEGAVTEYTRHDTVVGEKLREERMVTLRRTANGRAELVVSACRTQASVIVTAVADTSVDLAPPAQPMVLDAKARATLEARLLDGDARSLVNISFDDGLANGGDLIWTAVNTALQGHSTEAETRVEWKALARLDHKPLEVDGFRASFVTSVAAGNLRKLRDDIFGDEKRDTGNKPEEEAAEPQEGKAKRKKANKTKLVRLIFDGSSLSFLVVGKTQPVTIPLERAVTRRVEMQFRLRDVRDIVRKLTNRHMADAFQLAGEPKNMLSISWSDDHGSFAVHVPTADGEGRLVYTRLSEMDDGAADEGQQAIAA